ncbi:YkuS family protein [Wukongibacter baidiensis]|uniref:YkuS family protein n=1 Tax=Wukongibacter baidiensis TaxID=1723361 RepID=UPI003D7F4744
MGKTIGIQTKLNEIAEALTVNGFDVSDMNDKNREFDAIIYYNDKENSSQNDETIDSILKKNDYEVLKINAATTNIDDIMKILNKLT